MKYRELSNLILGRLFNPLKEEDPKEIIYHLQTNDFLIRFDQLLFDFGRKKYNSRGKTPNIEEIAVQPDIALLTVNLFDNLLKKYKNGNKFKLKEIREIIEYDSKNIHDLSSNQEIISEVEKYIKSKIDYDKKKYKQDIIYYIEKFENMKRISMAKTELNTAIYNLEDMEKKGEKFQSNKIFTNGLNAFLPQKNIDNRDVTDIVKEGRKKEAEGNRVPTFIPTIDRDYRIGGVSCGEMGTIAADTGVGKTFLGMVMFYNQIVNGHNVYYITLEEDKDEIFERLLAIHSNMVPKYRKLNIESEEWVGKGYYSEKKDLLDEIVNDLKQYNFSKYIIDVSGDTSYHNVKQQLINLSIGKEKAELVYIDYLQMLSIGKSNSVAADYKDVSKELLSFARSNKIAIIGLAQLKMRGEKPKMSDIRWSKSFANNSHFVYLIHREGYGLTEAELKLKGLHNNKKLELIIEKNRGAGKGFGMISLFFDQKYGYIQEYSDRHEQQEIQEELESIENLNKSKKDTQQKILISTTDQTKQKEINKNSKNNTEFDLDFEFDEEEMKILEESLKNERGL